MSDHQLSREFSICLIPTVDIVDAVQSIRQELPRSPYRDDTPHITLLRGISTNREMSDQELLTEIDSLIGLTKSLPMQATVTGISNKSNRFYSSSGLLLLRASKELLSYREDIISKLKSTNYLIETQEELEYIPHVTIRLGVPLEGNTYKRAQELFVARTLSFSHWMLFRLVLVNGERTMHEIRPGLV